MKIKTYRTSLDGLSPDSHRICRRILAELWAEYEVDLGHLDPIETLALNTLRRAGYLIRTKEGVYRLGDRSLYGEPE